MDADQFSANDVFTVIQHRVGGQSQQLPQYSSINNSGHDGGDFVFTIDRGNSSGKHTTDAPSLDELDKLEQTKLVLSRYQSAFERKDLGALQRLWPTMPDSTRKNDQSFFDHATDIHMTYKLVGKPVFQGDTAQLVFSQDLQFKIGGTQQKLPTSQVTMTLQRVNGQRSDDAWQISSVK
jgi:hypothetical protein